ncbi:MAG: hypothetical protein ACJ8FY_13190 [Gemmataceae bacterium]
MRALCGAIITAGALIGLGFTALGIGTRYSPMLMQDPSDHSLLHRDRAGHIVAAGDSNSVGAMGLYLGEMDRGLTVILIVLLIGLLIGLATTFIGLMYHHYRRHHEFLRNHAGQTGPGVHSSV